MTVRDDKMFVIPGEVENEAPESIHACHCEPHALLWARQSR
jgi:hypothetical protein